VAAIAITTLVFLVNSYVYFHEIVSEVYYLDIQPLRYLEKYILSICAPVVVLVVINVLCRSIISLTAQRERIAEEKVAAERFRAELITNVTHDIRTPLTSIINYVDLIDKLDIQDAELREYVAVLKGKSVRLKSLVNDLLDASKASTGNMEVTVETIELLEVVGQVVGGFDDALLAADLTYVNPDANRPIAILADGRHLYRVLENLFANVVKYAMPGTRVYIAVEESAQQVALSIKNTSKNELNISPEELLQQFVRGEQARSAEGNGLGLFIAEHLTRLMGASFALSINADLFEVEMVFSKPSAPA
jgi:signal transduction histidine kinase